MSGCSGNVSCGELLIGNTIDVKLVALRVQGEFINDANVSMTLRTKAGAVVDGMEDVPLANVNTSGEYLGQLPSSLWLLENAVYKLTVKAEKTGVADGSWTANLLAKERGING